MKNDYILKIRRSGNFYKSFGDDAIIIHYLMGYQFVQSKGGTGFPESSLEKVMDTLIANKIHFEVYENNKDITYHNYEKANHYKDILKSARLKYDKETRIDMICSRIRTLSDEKLEEILRMIEDAISS